MSTTSPEPEIQPLQPVLEELIRTRYCGSSLRLLLDKINIVASKVHPDEDDAYRLWLSDGSRVIQGVLMHDLHPFLNAGEVREGSYVSVTKYQLLRADRINRAGWVWVLAVLDMELDGHDGREAGDLKLEIRSDAERPSKDVIQKDSEESVTFVDDAKRKKKERPDSQGWSPNKRRKPLQFFSSPLKPKARPVLRETSTNSASRTPTKIGKFTNRLDDSISDLSIQAPRNSGEIEYDDG